MWVFSEQRRQHHLQILMVTSPSRTAFLGFTAGLLAIPIAFGIFGLVTLIGSVVLLVGEGLLGYFRLEEPVLPFIGGSLVASGKMVFSRPEQWFLGFLGSGLTGSMSGLLRRACFRSKGERTLTSNILVILNQFAVIPYTIFIFLIFVWLIRTGGMNSTSLLSIASMISWFPTLIWMSSWLYGLDLNLEVMDRSLSTEFRKQLVVFQVRNALNRQRINPLVDVRIEGNVIYLSGSVRDKREREDAEHAVRSLKTGLRTISRLRVNPNVDTDRGLFLSR